MSKTVFRCDRSGGTLRSPTTTSQGFLRVDGHAARAGIYEYPRADGSVQYELRPADEVHHPDSLASYESAPVTLEHPVDGEVNAENVRRHEVGHVEGVARADGDAVAVSLLVKDAKAIKAVKAGKRELSPGYKIRLDETSGFAPEYASPRNPTGRYHVIQRDIRVNHQAIVEKARGGDRMRLRMDSAEGARCDAAPAYAIGDRVKATADHMPGMAGMVGTVEIANEGTPPYYAVRLDDQKAFPGTHKWLAEDELQAAATRADGHMMMTTAVAGHQHLLNCHDWNGCEIHAGDTSWATSEGADNGHTHPWVKDVFGKYTIGESEGHTHGLLDDGVMVMPSGYLAPTAYTAPRADTGFDRSAPRREPGSMDKDEQIRSLKEQLSAAEAKLGPIAERATSAERRADTATAQLDTVNKENTELRAKIAAAATEVESAAISRERTRADAAEHALRTRNDEFEGLVADRVDLERKVAMVMGPEFATSRIAARELLATVVKRLDSQQDVSAKVSDVYLRARFDALVDLHNRNARSHQTIGDMLSRHDSVQREQRADNDSIEAKRAAWQRQGYEPLPNSREAAAARRA